MSLVIFSLQNKGLPFIKPRSFLPNWMINVWGRPLHSQEPWPSQSQQPHHSTIWTSFWASVHLFGFRHLYIFLSISDSGIQYWPCQGSGCKFKMNESQIRNKNHNENRNAMNNIGNNDKQLDLGKFSLVYENIQQGALRIHLRILIQNGWHINERITGSTEEKMRIPLVTGPVLALKTN